MRKNDIFNIPDVSSRIAKLMKWINGSFRVKAGRPLVDWFLWIGQIVEGRRKLGTVRVSVLVVARIWTLYQQNGLGFVVKYLKASQVLLMQASSGHVIPDSTELGVRVARAKDGMPKLIPRLMRQRIRNGDAALLTLWVSWLGLYRVLDVPGKMKLSTITDHGKVFKMEPYSEFVGTFWAKLKSLSPFGITELVGADKSTRNELMKAELFVINKNSPVSAHGKKVEDSTISTSMRSIVRSGLALFANAKVFDAFESFASHFGNDLLMETLFMVTEGFGGALSEDKAAKGLGKLGLKFEAAGKVRVFAMVDCWTQWLLRPLHDLIFKTLKGIPQDGTWDQVAPIRLLLENPSRMAFQCYDLSAATDRLPVSLQVEILKPVLGDKAASWWRSILVDRTYWVNDPDNLDPPFGVRYAVGQPMGALSSWAMLALTHHYIIQLAAVRAGYLIGWFKDYAVLGDDVTISSGKVSQQYLNILSDLGVKVGLAKSLISKQRSLEFAKRFVWRGVDCSPVSFKELAAAKSSFTSLEAFMVKFRLSLSTLFRIQGKGYKVIGGLERDFWKQSARTRKALVALYSPGHIYHISLPDWIERTSIKKTRSVNHWDKVGWYLAMHWVGSLHRKIRSLENLLKSYDGVVGETGLGLTDMEFFDINSVASSAGSGFLKGNARAISMMSMELYYHSFMVLRQRLETIKDEYQSIKEFLEFHGPKAGIHWEILGVLPAEVQKLEELLEGLSIPDSLERRSEDIIRDRPFKWYNQWNDILRVSRTGKLPSAKYSQRVVPEWLLKAQLVDIEQLERDVQSPASDPEGSEDKDVNG